MERKPTETQEQILKFIVDHIEEDGSPPTIREISGHFGYSAPTSARTHLQALAKKGYIILHEGRARGIELVTEKVQKLFWSISGIPLVGRVAAGTPILAEENIEDVLQFKGFFHQDEGLFALRVKGDSMIEAGIYENDLIIVRPQTTANIGEIVVAIIDDEGTVKRYGQAGDHIRLEPANKNYLPIITRDVRIVGKVIGLIRDMQGPQTFFSTN